MISQYMRMVNYFKFRSEASTLCKLLQGSSVAKCNEIWQDKSPLIDVEGHSCRSAGVILSGKGDLHPVGVIVNHSVGGSIHPNAED